VRRQRAAQKGPPPATLSPPHPSSIANTVGARRRGNPAILPTTQLVNTPFMFVAPKKGGTDPA
jgi:hypothetical protein